MQDEEWGRREPLPACGGELPLGSKEGGIDGARIACRALTGDDRSHRVPYARIQAREIPLTAGEEMASNVRFCPGLGKERA